MNAGHYQKKHVRTVTYLLTKLSEGSNIIGLRVHLLVSPIQGLDLNPGHEPKGHYVPLGCHFCQGLSPALGGAPMAWFGLVFVWLWLVKS